LTLAVAARVRTGDEVGNSVICAASSAMCSAQRLGLCEGAKPGLSCEEQWPEALVASSILTIPARRPICHRKEWTDHVLMVTSGWAASSLTLQDGRRQILSFILPGDFVSIASVFEPMIGRSVDAITDVTCRRFRREDFKAALIDRPELYGKLFEIWADENAQADQLALDLGRRRADERIARLIVSLAEQAAKRGMAQGETIDFPLRQRHIADATGLTSVHVSKVLGDLQRKDMIDISDRLLTILNPTALRRLAGWHE
jgi:CRP-like cAMP-binding protein